MHVAEWPALATAYDRVGAYDQDAVNGFSDHTLTTLVEIVNPGDASHILDGMAGNGNLTRRLYDYCLHHGLVCPALTLIELASRQCEFATRRLADTPATIVWGDILTMEHHETGTHFPAACFDRVVIKSGTHEIPRARQQALYHQIWQVLEPGGLFINLGFLFDEVAERDQFRELCRVKDRLAGLDSAVDNRYFLTRDEFYTCLQQAGFQEIRCAMQVSYMIDMRVLGEAYFPPPVREEMQAALQAEQAKAMLLRRKGRIHFQGDNSVMLCPGEITVARRPA